MEVTAQYVRPRTTPTPPPRHRAIRCPTGAETYHLVIRVPRADPERTNVQRAPGRTRSDAGARVVVSPAFLREELRQHLAWFTEMSLTAWSSSARRGHRSPFQATFKDTMVRAGQSSEKAALIYQHSDEERQRDVAAGLDDMARAERAKHHTDKSAHHKEKPTGS